MESSTFASAPSRGTFAVPPIQQQTPDDPASLALETWVAQANNGREHEERALLAHTLKMAISYPHFELNLRVRSPKAVMDLPPAVVEAWILQRGSDKTALTDLVLPEGLSDFPDWLAKFPPFTNLTAFQMTISTWDAEDRLCELDVKASATHLSGQPRTSPAQACLGALAIWSSPQPGTTAEDAAARSIVSSALAHFIYDRTDNLKLPAAAARALDQLDPQLVHDCLEAKEALGNGQLKSVDADGLMRLPGWLGSCPDLTRLTLLGFKGKEVDLRPLPPATTLVLNESQRELDVHSFHASVVKQVKDLPFTHYLYTPGDPSQVPHTTLRAGQANSNGVTTIRHGLLDQLAGIALWGSLLDIEQPQIVCADLSAWVGLQWISNPSVAGTDKFLEQLESPESVQKTLPPDIREMHFALMRRMPQNHLVSRDRWGEFVASRFDLMAEDRSEVFLITSTTHGMAMQLSRTAHGLAMKFYDPNQTIALHQRCVHPEQLVEIKTWKFDGSVLGRGEQAYFDEPKFNFGEDGADSLIALTLIPEDAVRRCSRPVPLDRHVSLDFGPASVSESHVSIMRHAIYGRHFDVLMLMHDEVKASKLPADRVRRLMEWSDTNVWIGSTSWKTNWPAAVPIVNDIRTRAGLEKMT